MSLVWPPSLPQRPLVEGWNEKMPKLTVRTENDAGVPKVRRRFTAAVRPVEALFMMSGAQVETLDSFYTGTLGGGALRFEWVHPRTGVTREWRIVEPPEVDPAGSDLMWKVTCRLEVMP